MPTLNVVRELGAALALMYVIHRCLRILPGNRSGLYPYVFFAQPTESAGAAIDVEILSPGSPHLSSLPREHQTLAQRFAAGDLCAAHIVKSEVRGYIWIAAGDYVEDEVDCRYVLTDDRLCWDYDVFVVPRYRLGRTFQRLWSATGGLLHLRGFTCSVSRISRFNASSIRAHERMNAYRVGWATFVRAFGVQLTIRSTAPRVSISTSTEACPHFKFSIPPYGGRVVGS
ncbi:MAG: hypothetical protein RIE06_27835 [Roseibium album]|uniref:hypothetical protein n=1 Tax=Roseibium album TaxID=311410 RepID=UPI0032EC0648